MNGQMLESESKIKNEIIQQKAVREGIENEVKCPRCYDMMGDKLLSPLQKANYTIDGEKAEIFSKVFILHGSDVVAERQLIMAIHNGTFYVFEFGGHFNTFNKPGEKEIGQHIIESINWTEPSPDLKWRKYNNSTLGVSLEYPSSWNLNSTTNAMCDPETGTCFLIELKRVYKRRF